MGKRKTLIKLAQKQEKKNKSLVKCASKRCGKKGFSDMTWRRNKKR